MSTGHLWSLLTTRLRPSFSSHGSGVFFRYNTLQQAELLPRSIYHQQPFRRLSLKHLQERKTERSALLRSTVYEHYRNTGSGIDWNAVRRDLEQQNLNFRSNFEFVLLNAFSELEDNGGQGQGQQGQQDQLDQTLFQSIASFVHKSPDVTSNKIAAIRFCRFLSSAPEFLTTDQTVFIRRIAEQILAENIQVFPIIIDVFTALANSSADNCRYALEIYSKYIKMDFKLKLDLLNIIFESLVRYELTEELYDFLREYHQILTLGFDLTGALLRTVAKKRTFSENPEHTLDIIRFLSSNFALVEHKYKNPLLERILTRKLGYDQIEPAEMSPQGQCSVCGQKLSGLAPEEFKLLQDNFRRIIFDKNDQYLISNLQEYEVQLYEFEEMIKLDPPKVFDRDPTGSGQEPKSPKPKYDLIIDGLNLSYRQSASVVPDKFGLRTYSKVYKVKDLDQHIVKLLVTNRVLDRFNHSLLIGRDHMRNWLNLNKLIRQKKPRVDYSYLLNRTRDDNYILYAAIQHPDTQILSGDYFRDHREKFKEWYLRVAGYPGSKPETEEPEQNRPNLPQLFGRWLRQRQIRITEPTSKLEYPNQFDMRIHVHENAQNPTEFPNLHIPVVVERDPYSNEDHQYEWYCAKHAKKAE